MNTHVPKKGFGLHFLMRGCGSGSAETHTRKLRCTNASAQRAKGVQWQCIGMERELERLDLYGKCHHCLGEQSLAQLQVAATDEQKTGKQRAQLLNSKAPLERRCPLLPPAASAAAHTPQASVMAVLRDHTRSASAGVKRAAGAGLSCLQKKAATASCSSSGTTGGRPLLARARPSGESP